MGNLSLADTINRQLPSQSVLLQQMLVGCTKLLGFWWEGLPASNPGARLLDDLVRRLPRALDVPQHALDQVQVNAPGDRHAQVQQRPAAGDQA